MSYRHFITQCVASSLMAFALVGCGSSTDADLSSSILSSNFSSEKSITDTEIASLKFMREEEKLARDVYWTLYDQWDNEIFNNIASSEQQHTDAVLALMEYFDVDDPAVADIGVFINQELQALSDELIAKGKESELSALWVGAFIEEADIEDIANAMETIENTDIFAVYENLLCGSRNHLRSFVKNIESKGDVYSTQIQAVDDQVVAILSTPNEQCGGN